LCNFLIELNESFVCYCLAGKIDSLVFWIILNLIWLVSNILGNHECSQFLKELKMAADTREGAIYRNNQEIKGVGNSLGRGNIR
jgi:hypothetical protein